MRKNNKAKPGQLLEINKVTNNMLGVSLRKTIFKPKDIRRILSKLITAFIRREVKSEEAKTLSYLCQSYLHALEQVEIEERLRTLEQKAKIN